MQTKLSEVESQLADLRDQREKLQASFNQATQDCDPDGMIKAGRELNYNEIKQRAYKSKLLGVTREETERERLSVVAERRRLEEQYKVANRILAEAIVKAEEARILAQTIGVQLFSLDQKVETLRQDRNEADAKQKLMVAAMLATWQDNFKAPNEMACDLD